MNALPYSLNAITPLVMVPYPLIRCAGVQCVDGLSPQLGLEWPREEWDRLQQLSVENRRAFFAQSLATYLYDHFFAGIPWPKVVPPKTGSSETGSSKTASSETASSEQIRIDNDHSAEDDEWFARLHAENHGLGYFDPDWTVIHAPLLAVLIVQKDGLTLRIQRDRHLQNPSIAVKVGDRLSIKMPANRLDTYYYQAIGNQGPPTQQRVDLYWNVTYQGAETLMSYWSEHLNQAAIPFCLKLFHRPSLFERWDGGILQISKTDYPDLMPLIETYWQEHSLSLHANVPFCTLSLAPGLTVAECPETTDEFTDKFTDKPTDKSTDKSINSAGALSFGQHRCRLIAAALVPIEEETQSPTPMARWAAIEAAFTAQNIDWHRPYLTSQTTDIYHPFNARTDASYGQKLSPCASTL